MTEHEHPEFLKLLTVTLAGYGKPLPETAMTRAWLVKLAPFSLATIRAALVAYEDENGQFPPVPAGIAQRCRLMDGRPGAEEAWAMSIASQDESATVVWTSECAQAFAAAAPILALRDEVGARMAFKEAYTRIVAAARAESRQAEWLVSLGWDKTQHAPALQRAVIVGYLPAPQAQALLPGPYALGGDDATDESGKAQLAKIREMLAQSAITKALKAEEEHEARKEAERQANAAWCAATNERVYAYATGGAV